MTPPSSPPAPPVVETQALAILHAARDLLSDPKRWTKGEDARDKRGRDVLYFSPAACSWCIDGALRKVAREMRAPLFPAPVPELLRELLGGRAHTLWNDAPERTHAEVLDLLDRAIAQAEGT